MRIAALLTSHNRRASTLACLQRLDEQDVAADVDVFLVDAGSVDGTADAVAQALPTARVIRRGPELFWNGGTRVAFASAVADGYPYYLLLNDDTLLDRHALGRLLSVHDRFGGCRPTVVAGATRDPHTGVCTYGGVRRLDRRRPLRFSLVGTVDTPIDVDTMNGNAVLISHSVVERVGTLDPVFTHHLGDFDYGLRARRAGCRVIQAPGTIGTCARNAAAPKGDWRQELAHLRGAKGLPPREWLHFARRWGGAAWPLYAASPYVRRLGKAGSSQ